MEDKALHSKVVHKGVLPIDFTKFQGVYKNLDKQQKYMDEHIKQIKKESIVSGDLDLAIKIRALEKYREDAFLSLIEKICKKEDYTYTEHFKGDKLFYSLRHKPNKSTSLMYEGIVEINNETPISEDYIKLRTLAIDTLCSETLKRQKENYHSNK